VLEQACLGVFGLMTNPATVSVPSRTECAFGDSAYAPTTGCGAEIGSAGVLQIRAEGHDVLLFLFKLLDECLYAQSGLGFIAREARVVALGHPKGALERLQGPIMAGTDAGAALRTASDSAAARHATAATTAAATAAAAATAVEPSRDITPQSRADASADSVASMAADSGGSCSWWAEVELRGEPLDLSKHPQGTEVKAITFAQMTIVPPVMALKCTDTTSKGASIVRVERKDTSLSSSSSLSVPSTDAVFKSGSVPIDAAGMEAL